MFARLKSLVQRERPDGFLAGMRRYFLQMAGVVGVSVALSVGFDGPFKPILPEDWLAWPIGFVWSVCFVFAPLAFAVAPYAAVADGFYVHRAILASVRSMPRHLPAIVTLLAAVAMIQSLAYLAVAPPRPLVVDREFVLRQVPAALLQHALRPLRLGHGDAMVHRGDAAGIRNGCSITQTRDLSMDW